MIKRIFNWALIGVVMLSTASCAVQKHLTYLQDMEYGVPYEVLPMQEIHLQPGDQLSIKVSCKQPELAIPFNIMSGSISTDGTGATTASSFARVWGFSLSEDCSRAVVSNSSVIIVIKKDKRVQSTQKKP